MKRIIQIIWLAVGVLAIVVLSLGISVGLDIKETTQDVKLLWSQVTIDDLRQGLSLIEKQLDNDTLALQIEQRLTISPLGYTPENWQAFLDFCGRTGYVTDDGNWQRFRYGQLKP